MASTSFSFLSPAMDSTSTSRTRIYKKTKQAAVQQWHGKPQLVRKGKKKEKGRRLRPAMIKP